ncbi:MAG: DUF4303 domain-containing protein [Flavobacteriaceae bacterium]|jgi:hypothetical protein|nr:DUF4303 domain-containing protein [Flavobacteriaceae bacterium]
MKWTEFKQKTDFEDTVFNLTKKSLEILGNSEEFKNKEFGAFAFNCASSGGNISLSFDTDTSVNLKEKGYYPSDWTNEVMECDVAEIGNLWKKTYSSIQQKFETIVNADDFDDDEFEEDYLNSLRKVLVRLENENAFLVIKTKPDFWTLVTQIDADTDEEEEKLEQIRQKFKN